MTEFWIEVPTPSGSIAYLTLVPTNRLHHEPELYGLTLSQLIIGIDRQLAGDGPEGVGQPCAEEADS